MEEGNMRVFLGRSGRMEHASEMKPSRKPITQGMVEFLMPDETQVHIKIGKEAKLEVSRDIQPVHFFVNVKATSLKSLPGRIGGLLGEDDHMQVSAIPLVCLNQRSHPMLLAVKEAPSS